MDNNFNNFPLNPIYKRDENGNVITNDEWLNKILADTQSESGPLAVVIPAVTFEEEKDDKEKVYIILVKFYEDDKEGWFVINGRQDAYDLLINLVRKEEIDPNESFVIAGTVITEESNGKANMLINDMKPITVFRFLKTMRDTKKIIDKDLDFDIDEFDSGSINGDNTILESE